MSAARNRGLPLPPGLPVLDLPLWATYLDDISFAFPLSSAAPNGKRLLAMGDSWFNYLPHYDVIWWLRAKYGFACESVAVIGEKLTDMASSGHQLCDLRDKILALDDGQRAEIVAVIVSGGGDDIVGCPKVLAGLLNGAGSGKPPINDAEFNRVVDTDLRNVLIDVLSSTSDLVQDCLHRTVPIYLHGYAHPVPDGRPGPISNWLKPAFDSRGYANPRQCTDIMESIIDRFNAMQLAVIHQVSTTQNMAAVCHIDVRPALTNSLVADAYKSDWQNEIHPTIPSGFEKVADMFAAALTTGCGRATASRRRPRGVARV
jgi:hypothetical protein